MEALANVAEGFIGLFQEGGNTFMGLVTGIVPLLIVLMTFVNAIIAMVGPERIDKVGEWAARDGLLFYPIRYIVLSVSLGLLFDQPNGVHHGAVSSGEVQTGVLRFGGFVCAPTVGRLSPCEPR